jgi:hypothetical protein
LLSLVPISALDPRIRRLAAANCLVDERDGHFNRIGKTMNVDVSSIRLG